jgi:hypothetical protein
MYGGTIKKLTLTQGAKRLSAVLGCISEKSFPFVDPSRIVHASTRILHFTSSTSHAGKF